jgi:nicotinamidase-related amidase
MFHLGRPLYSGDALLANIKNLLQKARSANIPIIYAQHCGSSKSPFEKNSPGWNIHPSIRPSVNDYVIEKRYSDSFRDTALEQVLKQLEINHMVVFGLATEGCVDTTIRRASSLGYTIELASDCHSTTDSTMLKAKQIINHHNDVLKIFSEVKESKDIVFVS